MKNQTLTIGQQELLELLMNVDKPTFVNIVSQTIPTMKKTDNPYFDKVVKVSKGNYFIGGSYEDMVNTRMGKEGMEQTFESKECSVGNHIGKCVQFNEKLNRYYLQYFTFSKPKSTFEFEGNEIEKQLFESYMVKRSETSRQPQENKHDPKSLGLSSILEMSLNGNRYVIER
jgi:uncharacterized membrane-anchored protein YhcB (DUF1043 family)